MIYFEKSLPPPECLESEKQKVDGDYKCGDVVDRLKRDFCNKCYICESKNPASINVEHFVAHQGNKDLKFSWDNLFWSCAHCNNTKHTKFDSLLNCTIATDRVEFRIRQKCNPFPHETVQVEELDDDSRTRQTRNLLDAVYNGTTKLKTIEAANIRTTLLKELQEFQELLMFYFDIKPFKDKELIFERIKGHLNKSSAFTAIKRWTIRDNPVMNEKLGHLIAENT